MMAHIIRIARGGLALLVVAPWLCLAAAAFADGLIPPNPYHYLHPPSALSSENKQPSTRVRKLPAGYVRSVSVLSIFTPDKQAGISISKGLFHLAPSSTSLTLRISPEETPPGLPQQVAVDGNSYRITATQSPSERPAQLTKAASVVLKYPHVPIAMYLFSGGRWTRICYEDSSVLTESTILCRTRRLGTFAAAIPPSTLNTSSPPQTPWYRLNPYIPVAAALLLIAAAIILGYQVSRPRVRRKS